jgi:deazaflavin-dependent oxidoreductase (nitroreductase family)
MMSPSIGRCFERTLSGSVALRSGLLTLSRSSPTRWRTCAHDVSATDSAMISARRPGWRPCSLAQILRSMSSSISSRTHQRLPETGELQGIGAGTGRGRTGALSVRQIGRCKTVSCRLWAAHARVADTSCSGVIDSGLSPLSASKTRAQDECPGESCTQEGKAVANSPQTPLHEPSAVKARLPPRWFMHLFWHVHRGLYRLTAGRLGLWRPKPNGWGTLRLTTIGRRTGRERNVMVGYFEDGPNLVTMAMNGWGEGEPAWWLNLQAHPDVGVDLAGGPRDVTGRAAHDEERERLWARWREIDKNLDACAARRSTETAVVILEPRPPRQVEPSPGFPR